MVCVDVAVVILCSPGQEKSCLVLNIGGIGIECLKGGHEHEKDNVACGTLCFVVV